MSWTTGILSLCGWCVLFLPQLVYLTSKSFRPALTLDAHSTSLVNQHIVRALQDRIQLATGEPTNMIAMITAGSSTASGQPVAEPAPLVSTMPLDSSPVADHAPAIPARPSDLEPALAGTVTPTVLQVDAVRKINGLLQLMQSNSESRDTQEESTKELCALACNPSAARLIQRLDGLPAIYTAMQKHAGAASLQAMCCRLLAAMAAEPVMALTISRTGISRVHTAMLQHPMDLTVQMSGVRALLALSRPEPNRPQIIQVCGKATLDMLDEMQTGLVQAAAETKEMSGA